MQDLQDSEKARMLAGQPYDPAAPVLVAERARAQAFLAGMNRQGGEWRAEDLRPLFGAVGAGTVLRPAFACDYGYNISIGRAGFINFNCVFLDCAPINIGDHLQMAPAVQLYTALHPLDAAARRSGVESARPITIGNNVWIGGGAIVLPGVTIGDDAVVAAGSVVTRDVAAGTLAAGNPARPVRQL